MNTKAQAHMEYSEDIVLMLTVNREDVLRPYQSHKLVWAGIQWLEAPFWFFCPLAQLGSPGKTHEYSAHLLPVAVLVHIPLADARGGGPRGGVGEIVAGGGGEDVALGDVEAQVGILK